MYRKAMLGMNSLAGWMAVGSMCLLSVVAFGESRHVWEKVEIALRAEKSYENPYKEVEVWLDLKGPGFEKRCYGFWDGDNLFRVRRPAANTRRSGLTRAAASGSMRMTAGC